MLGLIVLVVQDSVVIGHARSLTKGLETVNFHVSFRIDRSGEGDLQGFAGVALCKFGSIRLKGKTVLQESQKVRCKAVASE